VCWNTTGTIVASSGDDGQVRLWKSNYMDNWKCVASLRGDGKGGRMENVSAAAGSAFRDGIHQFSRIIPYSNS
jgi:WD40 repeat protein